MPNTIQGLLSIVSFCLEFLFKGELNLKNFFYVKLFLKQ